MAKNLDLRNLHVSRLLDGRAEQQVRKHHISHNFGLGSIYCGLFSGPVEKMEKQTEFFNHDCQLLDRSVCYVDPCLLVFGSCSDQ